MASNPFITNDFLLAIQNTNSPVGHIGNAMKVAQTLIHKLDSYCSKIQLTGRMRFLDLTGHKIIEILAVAKLKRDLTRKILHDIQMTDLHFYLLAEMENLKFDNNIYTFDYNHYQIKLTALSNLNQLPVAQLQHTGPAEFTSWLFSSNTIPWGFSIKDYQINDNNRKPIKNLREEHDVFSILDYEYIHLIDREDGSPQLWDRFKKVH